MEKDAPRKKCVYVLLFNSLLRFSFSFSDSLCFWKAGEIFTSTANEQAEPEMEVGGGVCTETGWVTAALQCVFNVCVFMNSREMWNCVCACDVLFVRLKLVQSLK